MKDVNVASEVDIEEIAAMTTGFTGADLANLINEAAIVATRRGAESITNADFTAAFERIVAGTERKTRLMNPDERTVVSRYRAPVARDAVTDDKALQMHGIPHAVFSYTVHLSRVSVDTITGAVTVARRKPVKSE